MHDVEKGERNKRKEGDEMNERVRYLARVRNEALMPLNERLSGVGGRVFYAGCVVGWCLL